MRHKCRKDYCFKFLVKKKKFVCRFRFPKPLMEEDTKVDVKLKITNLNKRKKKKKSEEEKKIIRRLKRQKKRLADAISKDELKLE